MQPGLGAANEPLAPETQLARCLVRERDCQNAMRRHPHIPYQVRDPVSHDARFATSGSGHDQERTSGMDDRLLLALGEAR